MFIHCIEWKKLLVNVRKQCTYTMDSRYGNFQDFSYTKASTDLTDIINTKVVIDISHFQVLVPTKCR